MKPAPSSSLLYNTFSSPCLRPFRTAAVAALLTVSACMATAASPTYTYTYVGNNFTYFNTSPTLYASTAHVSMTMVFAAPLAANLDFQTLSPMSWSITDSVNHFSSTSFDTNSSGNVAVFDFSTNASGTLTGWDIRVSKSVGLSPSDSVSSRHSTTAALDMGDYYLGTTVQMADITNNSGKWTLSVNTPAVPEPTTLLMSAVGLACLAMRGRRHAQGGA